MVRHLKFGSGTGDMHYMQNTFLKIFYFKAFDFMAFPTLVTWDISPATILQLTHNDWLHDVCQWHLEITTWITFHLKYLCLKYHLI